MSDSTWTADDLARIRKAIASGLRTVQFADRSQTWASMDDLMAAEARIAAALATGRKRVRYISTKR